MRRLGTWALLAGIGLSACSSPASPEVSDSVSSSLTLTSPAFADGGPIPRQYTCDGADASPPLAWSGVPDGVAVFAIIVEDPDAGGFIHWVLSEIPGEARELPEGEGDAIGVPGVSSFGGVGWRGPCPPSGEHHYVFTLYALSGGLRFVAPPTASQMREALQGVAVAQAQLTGVYRRAS